MHYTKECIGGKRVKKQINSHQHPVMALQKYRERTGIAAKIINVQMASTRTTINDPEDPNALEIIGFDTSAPQVISEFIGDDW